MARRQHISRDEDGHHEEFDRDVPDEFGEGGQYEGLNEFDPYEEDERQKEKQDEKLWQAKDADDALRAGEKAKKKAKTSRKRALEAAEAQARVQQGLLKKDFNAHQARRVAVRVEHKNPDDALEGKPIEAKPADFARREKLEGDQQYATKWGARLADEPLQELYELRKKLRDYKLVETEVGKKKQLASEKEDERLKTALSAPHFDTHPKGIAPDETIAKSYKKSGHEDPHLGIIEGWRGTNKFVVEQQKRKYNALLAGERSFKLGPAKLGANQEQVIKTTRWKPLVKKQAEKGQDQFTVQLESVGARAHIDDSGNRSTEGQNLQETLRKAGFDVRVQERYPGSQANTHITIPGGVGSAADTEMRDANVRKGQNMAASKEELQAKGENAKALHDYDAEKAAEHKYPPAGKGIHVGTTGSKADGTVQYVIKTKDGTHLNPDEIALLQQALHVNHGLKSFKADNTVGYQREQYIRDIDDPKRLPKGVEPDEVAPTSHRRTLVNQPVEFKWGERGDNGQLVQGQSDKLALRVGNKRALTVPFKEDTDAIGWGRSYRPGNTEISRVALALPRADRDRRIFEAYHSADSDHQLDQFVAKEHPELETGPEREEQKEKYRAHARDLAAAGFGSAYYTAKNQLPRRVANKAYAAASHAPFGLGEKVKESGKKTGWDAWVADYKWGVHKPLSDKMDRARYRVRHPLGDPEDKTMAGITFEHGQVKGWNVPAWYNRRFPIDVEERAGRKVQRDVDSLSHIAHSREGVNDFLQGNKKSLYRKVQARSAVWDPERRLSDNFLDRVQKTRQAIDTEMKTKQYVFGPHKMEAKEAFIYRTHLKHADQALKEVEAKIAQNPDAYTHEELKRMWEEFAKTNVATEGLSRGALIGLGGVAGAAVLAGAGVLAVDRYQVYKQNKGQDVRHPILDTVTPETVKVPKVRVRKTAEYRFPHNTLTDALDLEHKKVPVAGRLSLTMEQKLRLRNHRDVSGEPYRNNVPLLGGIGFRAPQKPGKVTDGVLRPVTRSDLPIQKNLYVGNHKLVQIGAGPKETWRDRNHTLTAGNNRFPLRAEDRDALVRMSTTRQGSGNPAADRLRNFYRGDQKLVDMLDDKTEIDRVWKKHDKKMRNKNKYSKNAKKVKMRGEGELLEEYRERKTQEGRAGREVNERIKRVTRDQS